MCVCVCVCVCALNIYLSEGEILPVTFGLRLIREGLIGLM